MKKKQDLSCFFLLQINTFNNCHVLYFCRKFYTLKLLVKNILPFMLITGFLISGFHKPAAIGYNPDNCDVDTSRITVLELTVLGMHSVSINEVQNILDETCGVNFNFACWSDTVVFIEYDSLLTDKYQLMAVIQNMGYRPSIRQEYKSCLFLPKSGYLCTFQIFKSNLFITFL